MNKIIVRRFRAIKGCYGERLIVNTKHKEVWDYIKLISVWSNKTFEEPDGTQSIMYELPIGYSADDDLIRWALNKLNVVIEEG